TMLSRDARKGIRMILYMIAAGIILQFLAIYLNNVNPVIVSFSTPDSSRLHHIFTSIYAQWYNNLSAYAVGLLLGYGIYSDYEVKKSTLSLIRYGSAAAFFASNLIA